MTDQRLTYKEARNIYYRPAYEAPKFTEIMKNTEFPLLGQQTSKTEQSNKEKNNNNNNITTGKTMHISTEQTKMNRDNN